MNSQSNFRTKRSAPTKVELEATLTQLKAKLKEADIPEIRKLLDLGISQRLIALKYGVSQSLISRIKLGKNWQHVEE